MLVKVRLVPRKLDSKDQIRSDPTDHPSRTVWNGLIRPISICAACDAAAVIKILVAYGVESSLQGDAHSPFIRKLYRP